MSDSDPLDPPDETRRPGAAGADAEALGQEGAAPARTDAIASLRHRGFLLYVLGSLVSNAGNLMRTTAVGWEVYARTKDPLSLGLVGLVLAVPVLLLALPAGALADRYPRKSLILIAQAGLAVSGAGLAWASWTAAPLAFTYGFLLMSGVFRAVGWPASQAFVTNLVPQAEFANAAMWRSVAYQISATLGPLIAGVLIAAYSPGLVYALDAASSLVLFTCLLFIVPGPQEMNTEPRSWKSLLDGARFVGRQPVILSTITLDMVAVLFGGATALLPIFAADVLHVGAEGFGWMRAMPSLGAIATGLILAVRPPMRHAGRAMLLAVAAFGVATIVFGLSTSFPLSLAALFALGAADNVSVVIRSTVIQLLTPDAMRGRVAAVNAVFIGTSNEIGEFESGLVASVLGAVRTVALGGVLTLVTVAAVAARWPQLRRVGALESLEPPAPDVSSVSP
ncbi:MAG TPA: MFS transporter [Rubricoccaceae bacterium]